MKITLIGGAGFIGTNLAIALSKKKDYVIQVVDGNAGYFEHIKRYVSGNVSYAVAEYSYDADFDTLVSGQNTVYHLASSNIPGNSNQCMPEELGINIVNTAKLLDACVRQGVQKVIFISSGGAVYGKNIKCPVREESNTNPITSYGIQKLAIEKMLYLYKYQRGLDYRVIRLSNPYGPFQRPDGRLGAVTTFVYNAVNHRKLFVYGDGTVIRDFIYIEDAIRGILNIAEHEEKDRIFNLGSGRGSSINDVIESIKRTINSSLDVVYMKSRSSDVPVNYLDIGRYEKYYGSLNAMDLDAGVARTADFFEIEKKRKISIKS